eukprot:3537-Chlamydomonas_euryale.AAC.1
MHAWLLTSLQCHAVLAPVLRMRVRMHARAHPQAHTGDPSTHAPHARPLPALQAATAVPRKGSGLGRGRDRLHSELPCGSVCLKGDHWRKQLEEVVGGDCPPCSPLNPEHGPLIQAHPHPLTPPSRLPLRDSGNLRVAHTMRCWPP